MPGLGHLFFAMVAERIRLFALLVRLGLHHLAEAITQAIASRGHGTGGGQGLLALALFSPRLPGRLGRAACGGHTGAQWRGLWRMGLGKVTQRLGNLRLVLFPAFAATASRWRPQTEDPAAAFGQATRDGLAPPPQDSFRHQGVARTRFQRHRSRGTGSVSWERFCLLKSSLLPC